MLVADRDWDGETGRTYLIYGRQTFWPSLLTLADAAFIGDEYDENAGWGISSAGDADGDGLYDLLIGVPQNDDAGYDAGAACLLFYPF